MSDHALLSPSSAKRWLNCYGSVAATAGVPRTDTEFSLRGTFGHDIAKKLLLEDADAASMLGVRSADGKIEFDAAMASAVQIYLDAVRSIEMTQSEVRLLVESRVQLTPKIWGTADALIWSNDYRRLDVFDLKLGAGVFVEAEANEQLLVYALAAMAEMGRVPVQVEIVNLHIVQPLYTGAAPHRTWTPSTEELTDFRARVAEASLQVEKKDAPLTPGSWCRFCPVRETCPAVAADALAGAQDLFEDLTPLTPVKAPPLLEMLTEEQLAFILTKAAAMESWIEAARGHAKARAIAGKMIPGHKLVESVGHRKWTDEQAALGALSAIGVDPWAPRKLISPAQAEKATKAAKEVTARLAVAEVVGVHLVPNSDRRKALTSPPSTDIFDKLSE